MTTYNTFTVTVADTEGSKTEHVRDAVKDALQEADLIVLELDHGDELIFEKLERV